VLANMVNRRSPVLPSRVQSPHSMSPPPGISNNSKKKKKKKGKEKGKEKSIDISPANTVYTGSIAHLDMYDREDEDEDDEDSLPPLEPLPSSRTGALHTVYHPPSNRSISPLRRPSPPMRITRQRRTSCWPLRTTSIAIWA
jgi:hypothetical protein